MARRRCVGDAGTTLASRHATGAGLASIIVGTGMMQRMQVRRESQGTEKLKELRELAEYVV